MRHLKLAVGALIVLAAAAALAVLGDLVERGSAQITGGGGGGMPYNQGPVTPGTCGPPMMFYNNTAPGSYLGCYSNGTFGAFGSGGGGGVTMLAQVGDLAVTKTTATQLTVCANCSNTTPASVNFRWYSQHIPGPAQVNITGPGTGSGTDFAYIYYTNGAGIVVGSPTLALSCGGMCTVAGTAISAFPPASVPIAQVHATSSVWDAVTATMDARSFLGTANVAGTAGINCSDSNGDLQCSADQSVTMYRTTVPGSLTAACTPNNFAMDTTNLYVCQASGNWLKFTSGAGTGTGTPGPSVYVNKLGANYTMTAADFAVYTSFINTTTGSSTFTLAPNTPQPPAGQCVNILNLAAGNGITIQRNGQNLNGVTGTMAIAGGSPGTPSSIQICSNGTDYYTPQYFFGFRGAQGTILVAQGGGTLATSGVSVNNVPIYGDGAVGVRNGQSLNSGSGTVGNLACAVSSNTDGNCGAASVTNFLGVFVTTNNFATEGQVTVNLDASSTVNPGDFICVSSTTAALLHANGTTACGTALVGIAAASGTGVTTILTSLRR